MDKRLKLTIELVPASSWGQNLRSIVKPKIWEKLRKEVFKNWHFRCSVCNSKGNLHLHEVWKYDNKKHIQKLTNLLALCRKCHSVKHIGFSTINFSKKDSNFKDLVKHFMKINNCDRETFVRHYLQEMKKFEKRSRYEWILDISFLNKI